MDAVSCRGRLLSWCRGTDSRTTLRGAHMSGTSCGHNPSARRLRPRRPAGCNSEGCRMVPEGGLQAASDLGGYPRGGRARVNYLRMLPPHCTAPLLRAAALPFMRGNRPSYRSELGVGSAIYHFQPHTSRALTLLPMSAPVALPLERRRARVVTYRGRLDLLGDHSSAASAELYCSSMRSLAFAGKAAHESCTRSLT